MILCHCNPQSGIDPDCGTGLYITCKLTGIQEVVAVKGFLDLSYEVQQKILEEREYWIEEYCRHVGEV